MKLTKPDLTKLRGGLSKIVVLAVVAAVVAGGLFYVLSGSDDKTVKARFTAAVGIYPGTPVRILGVIVGQVESVKPMGGYVEVEMSYGHRYTLPAHAGAVEVANSLVSDRYIQLAPVWRPGQDAMPSGATIPQGHTSAPSELDDIYAAIDKLSVALGPSGANAGGRRSGALDSLLDVAAANLKGNGAALGNSITQVSRAAQTLVNSKTNLFATVRNLQTLTTALKSSDTQVRSFNTLLAGVSTDLAAERGDLGAALHQLGIALDAVGSFVRSNATKFHTDLRGLRSILGTVVKQKNSVNEALAIAPVALANLVHAYDPQQGVIGTRSNLASLTNINLSTTLSQVCSTLVSGLAGSPLTLFDLGGNAQRVCDALGSLPTGSSGSLPTGSSGSLPTGSSGSTTTGGTGAGAGTGGSGLPIGTLVAGTK